MKKYCVYIHRRKDNNLPFYVGCCTRHDNNRSTGVKKFRRAFDFGQRTETWKRIKEESGGVLVEIPCFFDDKKDAYEKEKELVDVYGRMDFEGGILVNECSGGNGAPNQYNSEETKQKKSVTKLGELNPMFGKTGKDHPNTRRVINIKTSKVYESVSEAAEASGLKMKTLYNWLSGHRKNPTDLRFY